METIRTIRKVWENSREERAFVSALATRVRTEVIMGDSSGLDTDAGRVRAVAAKLYMIDLPNRTVLRLNEIYGLVNPDEFRDVWELRQKD